MTSLDFQPLLDPILDCASQYRQEWGEMESALESVLEDMELLQLQLDEKTLELADAHQQVTDLEAENRQLLERLEQQDDRLTETLAELKRLTDEQQQLQQTILLAAESSLTVGDEVRNSSQAAISQGISEEIAAELKLLREMLELQALRASEQAEAAHLNLDPPAVVSAPSNSPADASDSPAKSGPANSVMAQFAKLQKDVAQRKKRR